MPTNRTPIARTRSGTPVPPEALDLFAEMRNCSGDRWWELHSRLARLVVHKPWDWPVVQDPADPPGWRPNESAQARWRELAALVAARISSRAQTVTPVEQTRAPAPLSPLELMIKRGNTLPVEHAIEPF